MKYPNLNSMVELLHNDNCAFFDAEWPDNFERSLLIELENVAGHLTPEQRELMAIGDYNQKEDFLVEQGVIGLFYLDMFMENMFHRMA